MTNRKFCKTIIMVEVLSEAPINGMSLADISTQVTYGDFSGKYEIIKQLWLDGATTAQELITQGSDPEFFQLNEDGDDMFNEDDVVNGDDVYYLV